MHSLWKKCARFVYLAWQKSVQNRTQFVHKNKSFSSCNRLIHQFMDISTQTTPRILTYLFTSLFSKLPLLKVRLYTSSTTPIITTTIYI